jgi:hypothetical protein
MYKIIGADGKEYGPVSAEQLRQWQAEGRVNAQTKVQAEGSADWKTVAEIFPASTSSSAGSPVIVPLPQADFKTLGGDPAQAAKAVKGPAIFIIVLSILNMIATVFSFFWLANQDKFMKMLGLPEPGQQEMELQKKIEAMFSLPATIIGGILAVLCLFGAIKMMKLQSHGFAIATAIMMLVPCGNCCCFLNIAAGIWALTVLQKPEIKAAFE